MEGKKKIIVISILVLVIIIYIIINITSKSTNSDKYLMIDNTLLWQKQGKTWVQLNEVPDKFYDNKFTVYYKTKKRDNVIIQNASNNLYYFDKDYNELKFKNIKGITRNLNLKFANADIQNGDDDEYASEVLESTNASKGGEYTTKKITYDFDGDGILETLYVTTNFIFDVVDYDFSSIFYMVKNDKVSIIATDEMPFDFVSVLDIDNDNSYEVIMSYDVKNLRTLDTCYQLYDYINGKWNIIKKCS